MPAVQVDRAFSRRAGFQAYLIAGLSLAYAFVFLGFVRGHPADHSSAAVAWALLAAGGLATTIAVVSASSRVNGDASRWLIAVGVGYALLSAAHGTFAAIAEVQGVPANDVSPTDPRGLASFGLAGLWVLTLGFEIRSGNSSLPSGLGWLAIANGLVLIALFFATVAASEGLILVTGPLTAIILGPAFWIWTGRALRA